MTHHSRDTPQFYLTAPSPCPYLPGKEERKVFTHLVGERAGDLNDLLTHGGFRRSQSIAYRPACETCRACVSVRVIVNEFQPTRSMRRIAERNSDLIGDMRAAVPTSEQIGVRSYLDGRHVAAPGDMTGSTPSGEDATRDQAGRYRAQGRQPHQRARSPTAARRALTTCWRRALDGLFVLRSGVSPPLGRTFGS